MTLEDIIREVVRDAVRSALSEAEFGLAAPPVQVSEQQHEVRALSVVEAAQQLGISRSRLYELIADGELLTIQVGRRRLVLSSAIEDFLAEREEPRSSDCRFCGSPAVALYRRNRGATTAQIRICSSRGCHRQLVDTVTDP